MKEILRPAAQRIPGFFAGDRVRLNATPRGPTNSLWETHGIVGTVEGFSGGGINSKMKISWDGSDNQSQLITSWWTDWRWDLIVEEHMIEKIEADEWEGNLELL